MNTTAAVSERTDPFGKASRIGDASIPGKQHEAQPSLLTADEQDRAGNHVGDQCRRSHDGCDTAAQRERSGNRQQARRYGSADDDSGNHVCLASGSDHPAFGTRRRRRLAQDPTPSRSPEAGPSVATRARVRTSERAASRRGTHTEARGRGLADHRIGAARLPSTVRGEAVCGSRACRRVRRHRPGRIVR